MYMLLWRNNKNIYLDELLIRRYETLEIGNTAPDKIESIQTNLSFSFYSYHHHNRIFD